ncbi:conserved hypothetical protein [Beutenbergia cavernae DSM 12333]|uniref:WD40 domain protein beta Propeller n=1 Tax=Beutenbergia cavernae (strain ATCC BAA-8 / DSM 12333 / CCUG 43141 / JCM 11478 / NBRC 16432 / NCIMB 13614 / HKI 0122) TaxID=471853 RepID=C5BX63_BEUC1|nr:hypothetical protein [Beutenbergia cavernae]ACQ78738.1 conserved hypothetical protein [Beutenbergia cavernae DSM 12333]
MPRAFAPGQTATVWIHDVETRERHRAWVSRDVLPEAPNWTPDGAHLVLNGGGRLLVIDAERAVAPESVTPSPVDAAGLPPVNNDHVLAPDGRTVFASAEDGHLYAVPLAGGSARRVSSSRGPTFTHYLHGVSSDGATLSYVGLERRADGVRTNLFTMPAAGGPSVQLTDDDFPDDGAELGPGEDGTEWLWFSSERPLPGAPRRAPGHAQLFRMRPDGTGLEQLTHDERVNWFPHPSPGGTRVAYVSFPPGTLGHPADVADVRIRLLPLSGRAPSGADGELGSIREGMAPESTPVRPPGGVDDDGVGRPRDLARVFGGQGAMNVPSWAPDSRRLAYVDYSPV